MPRKQRARGSRRTRTAASLAAVLAAAPALLASALAAAQALHTSVVAAAQALPTRAAAPFDPRGEDWEGLSEFVRIAQGEVGASRVVLTSTLDMRKLKRSDALILVHPERPLDAGELSAFMHGGGRVVLLDDYGTGDGLLAHFSIRRVPLPARPARMLRSNPAFAIAEPASAHPAVGSAAHVVTNHATGLERPALSPLLVVRGDGEPDVLLAIAGAVGRGRFVAVGDASVVINAMLRYPGNRELAAALVRYAGEDDPGDGGDGGGGGGGRGGDLYVLANGFATTGTFAGGSGLEGAADRARHAAEETLETLRRDGLPPLVAYLAALAIGLGVALWTGTRAARSRGPWVPRFARPAPLAGDKVRKPR